MLTRARDVHPSADACCLRAARVQRFYATLPAPQNHFSPFDDAACASDTTPFTTNENARQNEYPDFFSSTFH